MHQNTVVPGDLFDHLKIDNLKERIEEACRVAEKITAAGVPLLPNLDHAAIFVDPPHLLTGPLKEIGYVSGWDTRCYPSPVDGHDYINVSCRLPADNLARGEGWFDYVAVVHPVDEAARSHMLGQGYGNPFVHHLTWGIAPPQRNGEDDIAFADRVLPFMVQIRHKIGEAIGDEPGTLITALPQKVLDQTQFSSKLHEYMANLSDGEYQIEAMQGGGFLIQFFVLTGGRIEVALRVGTQQTFNPKSVHKISEDEISAIQSD